MGKVSLPFSCFFSFQAGLPSIHCQSLWMFETFTWTENIPSIFLDLGFEVRSFPHCELLSLPDPSDSGFISMQMTDVLTYCYSCSHSLLQCYCLSNSACVLPRFCYFVHDLPKCQDTVNKMTITTSSLFFTPCIKHFLPTNKQSKMYLLLTFWDKRSGICQKTTP